MQIVQDQQERFVLGEPDGGTGNGQKQAHLILIGCGRYRRALRGKPVAPM